MTPYFSGIGIDLSDHHLRIAQMNFLGSVSRLEEIELPEGLVVDEQIVKPDELKKLLTEKLARLGFAKTAPRTTVLVPESRVFTNSTLLDGSLGKEERRARAREVAQRDIPVPFSQAQVCVSEGAREGKQTRTTVYAVEKTIFDPLLATFRSPFNLVAMEANSKALLRLLQRFGSLVSAKSADGLIGIVDIGHSWTTVCFYTQRGSNVFSRTIPHRIKEAVDLKNPLLPDRVVDRVVETIGETMLLFEQKKMNIARMIFAGVEAHDDRLKEKISNQQTSLPSQLMGEVVKPNGISKKQIHVFGAAIGAAIRSLHPRKYAYQHNFLKGS